MHFVIQKCGLARHMDVFRLPFHGPYSTGNTILYSLMIFKTVGSMVDVDAFPPKFRPIYEVNLISKIPENEFFNKFSSDRISRKRVHSYLEWCDRHDLSLEVGTLQ